MPELKLRNAGDLIIDTLPDECPHCHRLISPKIFDGRNISNTLELYLICPNNECNLGFFAYYEKKASHDMFPTFNYLFTSKGKIKEVEFTDTIKNISENFVKIYNEAYISEQEGLYEICGVGYRKALEFLIKDYLIKKNEAKKEIIEKTPLGKCIGEYVNDPKIKAAAKRATWLGNDETHYLRRWKDKSLTDLKLMIDLTIHWIEMEELTKRLDLDMPTEK